MTEYFVAQNVVDLWAEPTNSSKRVSQAILGAKVQILSESGDYALISTEDRYEGWVVKARLVPVWDDSDHFKISVNTLFADVTRHPDPFAEIITKLTLSTRIAIARRPEIDDYIPVLLPDHGVGYVPKASLHAIPDGSEFPGDPDPMPELTVTKKKTVIKAIGFVVCHTASRLAGTPYLWGGCTPFGIDCSGLVQLAYRFAGIPLLRDARLQFRDRRFTRVERGMSMADGNYQAGDLLAFAGPGDSVITHIGIALGKGRFIHSAGGQGVRIDQCSEEKYVKMFAGAVRLSPDTDLEIESA